MEKKTSRQLKKEQTKASLIKAAYELYSSRGIINTRMSDIAEAAGVSHGTVFLHFTTQEAFIAETVSYYCSEIALRTHELSESCNSLEEILLSHLDGIIEYEPFYTRLVIESRILPQAARDAFVLMQSAISFHFSKVLERGNPTQVPAGILFNMWMGLVHYYLTNGDLFAPDGLVLMRYRDTLTKSYVSLLHPAGTGQMPF